MSDRAHTLSTDEERLAALGYKQELHRGWSGFSGSSSCRSGSC
jgi:hypothetical protein